jgi:hypothetical protein
MEHMVTEWNSRTGLGPLQIKITICHTDSCCPTIYETGRGRLLVQGFVVDDPAALRALGLPPGETVVEVPSELLRQFGAAAGSPGPSGHGDPA